MSKNKYGKHGLLGAFLTLSLLNFDSAYGNSIDYLPIPKSHEFCIKTFEKLKDNLGIVTSGASLCAKHLPVAINKNNSKKASHPLKNLTEESLNLDSTAFVLTMPAPKSYQNATEQALPDNKGSSPADLLYNSYYLGGNGLEATKHIYYFYSIARDYKGVARFLFWIWNGAEFYKHSTHLENYDHNRLFSMTNFGFEIISLSVELYMISGLMTTIAEALSTASPHAIAATSFETAIFFLLFAGIYEAYANLGDDNREAIKGFVVNWLGQTTTQLNSALIDSPMILPTTGSSAPAIRPSELRIPDSPHTLFLKFKSEAIRKSALSETLHYEAYPQPRR